MRLCKLKTISVYTGERYIVYSRWKCLLFRLSEHLPEGRNRSRLGLCLAGKWLSCAGQGENCPTQLPKPPVRYNNTQNKKIPWKKCHSRNQPFSSTNTFCKTTNFLIKFSVMTPPKTSSCCCQSNLHMHNTDSHIYCKY